MRAMSQMTSNQESLVRSIDFVTSLSVLEEPIKQSLRKSELDLAAAFCLTVRLRHTAAPCAFARPPHESFACVFKI